MYSLGRQAPVVPTFGGPVEDKSVMEPPLKLDGNGQRYVTYACDDTDYYGQPSAFWEKVLDETGKTIWWRTLSAA